ncbi:MAG: regulatory protein RecX, partial [Treponema sp.]|nr:regulatory protein RecX [Treponema sp.]
MTIVSIKQDAGGELRRMELSDGSLFSFKTCYLPPVCEDESLCGPGAEGLEISAAEEEGFRFASSCLRAEKAALRLIARAEQNVFGLARKLEKRGHDAA